MYCSGSGFGIPHWSSGKVYHEDADGQHRYATGSTTDGQHWATAGPRSRVQRSGSKAGPFHR
jgi:hypothetical protein